MKILNYLPELVAYEAFDDYLDYANNVIIENEHFPASNVMAELNPYRYEQLFKDWQRANDITTDKDKADNIYWRCDECGYITHELKCITNKQLVDEFLCSECVDLLPDNP